MQGMPWLVMPAIVRTYPISLTPLRRPVVPGIVATDQRRPKPLIPMNFVNRDVTVVTPIHGVYAMCNPDSSCLPPIGGMANDPQIPDKGPSDPPVDHENRIFLVGYVIHFWVANHRIEYNSGKISTAVSQILDRTGIF